ncbi:MAG TPA: DUF805 domain-containing protein [Caulobacteraceae bacterium]|jgi:uncharacterized membrane protein YhaH (DUF805 family)
MGALGEFFGFEGRVTRLGYLWRCVAIGAVMLLLAGLATFTLTRWLVPTGVMGPEDALNIAITSVYLLSLWAGFALATRRLRDMGIEPVHFVPLYAAFWLVNAVLVEPMVRIDPADFRVFENGWIAFHWVAALPLLFWPSTHDDRHAAASGMSYDPTQPTAYLDWREHA